MFAEDEDSAVAKPYPETRWTVWARSLGVLLVGVASVVVSWTAVGVQRSVADNQKTNSFEDLALKHKNFDQQRETDEARLAASLIPFLRCNDDLQRASALQLLSKAAPGYGVLFGELLLQKCPGMSSPQRTEVSDLKKQSGIQKDIQDFAVLLWNARDYNNKGHDGPAARAFNQASEHIPSVYTSKVNRGELEKARRAFDDGRFSEAADRFKAAFSAIPDLR